jgi:hypothetical protein
MVELLIAGRSHLRVRAGSVNSQSNQFSIQIFRGRSDLLILQSTKELRKQKEPSFLLLISPSSPRLSVLPSKREPASPHRWYNEILLMRLSSARYGVRSVNDNEYSNRQRD